MSRFHLLTAATALTFAMSSLAQADTLKVGIMNEPASLSPAKITGGVWEEDILRDIFAGLVDIAPNGDVIPGVAERWDVSPDGLTYTFHLRESAWSDGTPVTADDFVFSLRYFVTPANAATGLERVYPIVNAEAIARGKAAPDTLGAFSQNNGRTLVLKLRQPAAYFIKMLVLPPFYPMPSKAVARYGNEWSRPDNIVTNGAFTPKQWVPNAEIVTVKNPHYYDAKHVAMDGVSFYPMEDRNAGITRFRVGVLDVLRDFPATRYLDLKQRMPKAVRITPRLGTSYYTFNLREGQPTADKRVREALSLLIRRDLIADKLLEGAVYPAYTIVPPGTHDYTPQPLAILEGSPDDNIRRAKTLLAEAGYDNRHPLSLKISYNSGIENKRIAIAIASMWKALGIRVTLENAEANVHYANLRRGQFQIGRAAWLSSYDDPQNFLQLTYSEGNNYGDYQDPEYRTLYERSSATSDPVARRALLEQAERRLSDAVVQAPIYFYTARNLVNPSLQGWEDNALDIHPSRWVSRQK